MSRLFEYDFDAFSVGTAEHASSATGCTAFRFRDSFFGAVDIRGGAAAVSDASSLSLENTWGMADGLMFAGGSSYGLAAAEGAKAELMKERASTAFTSIPSVPGAIVYDFAGRSDLAYPDGSLGAQAWRTAVPGRVWLGARGAGRNVSVGKIAGRSLATTAGAVAPGAEQSGQGAAFVQFGDVKVFCLSVVNAAGCILDLEGNVIAGNLFEGVRRSTYDLLAERGGAASTPGSLPVGNTTISVLITNARLDRIELNRLCTSVHMSLGRVIDPYATASDGDVYFAFTSSEVDATKSLSLAALSAIGARCAQNAVIASVQK